MPELVLVRHAATPWSGRRFCGRTDLALTPDGVATAEAIGRDLAASAPALAGIVSSPLRRARETAAAIAAAFGTRRFDEDDRWTETDFGAAEGLTFTELAAAMPDLAASLLRGEADIDWPGGETAASLRTRVEAAWHDLVDRQGAWIVVSHGGPLRIAIAQALDLPAGDVAVPAIGAVRRLQMDPVLPFRP